MIGIYKITNKLNNKCYIGQSIDIMRRWSEHKTAAKCLNTNSQISLAISMYGVQNFTFEVLEECELEKLDDREKFYITLYNSYLDGYNNTTGGSGCSGFAMVIPTDQLLEIYDLLANSKLTQREIANKYCLGEDTISEINNGKTRRLNGYHYPIRTNIIKKTILLNGVETEVSIKRICPVCGGMKDPDAKVCWACYSKQERIVERPLPEQLAKEILELGFSAVGRKYGVSDNAIRKWCRAYNMPVKKNEISLWLLKNNIE